METLNNFIINAVTPQAMSISTLVCCILTIWGIFLMYVELLSYNSGYDMICPLKKFIMRFACYLIAIGCFGRSLDEIVNLMNRSPHDYGTPSGVLIKIGVVIFLFSYLSYHKHMKKITKPQPHSRQS